MHRTKQLERELRWSITRDMIVSSSTDLILDGFKYIYGVIFFFFEGKYMMLSVDLRFKHWHIRLGWTRIRYHILEFYIGHNSSLQHQLTQCFIKYYEVLSSFNVEHWYVDSDYVDDMDDRRSTTRCVFTLSTYP